MMKKFAFIIAFLIIISVLYAPSLASVSEMPRDESTLNAVSNLTASDEFDIFIVGDSDPDVLLDDEMLQKGQAKKVARLADVQTSKQYKSIWMTSDAYSDLLDRERIAEVETYLDQGYSVYFLGLSDPSILGQLLIDERYSEVNLGEIQQEIAFVTKNKLGEYFLGAICSSSESKGSLLKTLLASTWNRRNDWALSRQPHEKKMSGILDGKVAAASGEDFTIGNDWACRFGWQQYVINTTYGNYTEWKAAFYLTNPVDGKNYYAMAIEGSMDPSTYSDCANTINYQSDSDGYGQNNLLRSYKPTASPSSNTYSFTLGSNLGKDSYDAGISASWEVVVNDLYLTDYSEPSNQKVNLLFTYDRSSSYAKQTTWQNTCFIYQAPAGSTYCLLDNFRNATFSHYAGSGVFVNSNGTLHYSTKVYK